MVRIGNRVRDGLRASPAIRVAWQTVRAWTGKVGALVKIRLR